MEATTFSEKGGRTTQAEHMSACIRAACVRKGWDLNDLAKRAGMSRTTLYHLERGRTRVPHVATLRKLAAVLEIDADELCGQSNLSCDSITSNGEQQPLIRAEDRRQFDRATNKAVDEVSAERAELFANWSESEWDELYSTFGTGGQLREAGVVDVAQSINRRREVVRKLEVIMDTHLADTASTVIDALYQMVQVPESR